MTNTEFGKLLVNLRLSLFKKINNFFQIAFSQIQSLAPLPLYSKHSFSAAYPGVRRRQRPTAPKTAALIAASRARWTA